MPCPRSTFAVQRDVAHSSGAELTLFLHLVVVGVWVDRRGRLGLNLWFSYWSLTQHRRHLHCRLNSCCLVECEDLVAPMLEFEFLNERCLLHNDAALYIHFRC